MGRGLLPLTPEKEGRGHSNIPVRRETAIHRRGWSHPTASRGDPGAERTNWGPWKTEVAVGIDVGDGGCDGLGEEVAMTVRYVEAVSPHMFLSNQSRGEACAAGEGNVVGDAVVVEDVVGVGEERWRLEEDGVVDGKVSGELGDDACLE